MNKDRTNPLVFILVCFFGSSAWLGSYASWVEMGIFTQQMPERWVLGAIITVTIQLASIGPVIFMIIDRCTKIKVSRGKMIQWALLICSLGNIPLALFWNKTANIFGSEHSVVIIVCVFFVGMINIASEVIFMPYMIEFRPIYLPAYFVGTGLSALIPSMVSVAQGSSDYECVLTESGTLEPNLKPHFSVRIFYLIMFVWMMIASFSFYLINSHGDLLNKLWNWMRPGDDVPKMSSVKTEEYYVETNWYRDTLLMIMLTVIGAELNGIIPSVLTFASLSYSQRTYFWSLILSAMAQPLGAFSSFFLRPRRLTTLMGLSAICTICTIFVVATAAQSPQPWFRDNGWGPILVVSAQIVLFSVGLLIRAALIEAFRDGGLTDEGREKRLFIGGLITQRRASMLTQREGRRRRAASRSSPIAD